MSEDPTKIPLPAVVFISILLSCIIVLCVIFQLLKRGKCCQVHGREGGEEEELEELIATNEPGELRDYENGKQESTATEEHDGPPGLGSVIAGSSGIGSTLIGITAVAAVSSQIKAVTAAANRATISSLQREAQDTASIDLSVSATSFPSIELVPKEDEPISNCGKLLLETTFSAIAKKMIISVIRAADVPGVDRGGTSMVEVHLTILPNKKFNFKTSAKPSNSPVFNERYTLYPVTLKTLEDMSMRVRLYGRKRLGKKVLGELEIPMTDIDLHSDLSDEPMWKTLLPYGMVAKLAALRETGEDEEFEMMMNDDEDES